MLKAIVLIQILTGIPVYGQDLIGKPCVISENVKGSCFYNAKSEVVYWIARVWSDVSLGGGPGSSEEFVGYPEALKGQQTYNRLIKEDREAGLHFATPEKKTLDFTAPSYSMDRRSIAEQFQHLKDATEASSRYVPGKESNRPLESYRSPLAKGSPDIYGWRLELADQDRWPRIYHWNLLVPAHIEERGNLNPDTLRIPFFLAGAELLAAKQRLVKACRVATDSVNNSGERWNMEWTPEASWPEQSRRDWDGICRRGQSKHPNFASLHRVLLDRLAHLDAAAEISRHIDRTISAKLGLNGMTPPRITDQDLAALADRLALMQSSMEEDLGIAVDLEAVSARLQIEFDAFIERKRREKSNSIKESMEENIKRGEEAMNDYYKRFPHAR